MEKILNVNIKNTKISYTVAIESLFDKEDKLLPVEYDLNNYGMLWFIIDYIDWKNNKHQAENLYNTLVESMSQRQIVQLRREITQLKTIVDDLIVSGHYKRSYRLLNSSNASDDVIEHIISMGKNYMTRIINKEDEAWRQFENEPLKPPFSQCLPYNKDNFINFNLEKTLEEVINESENKLKKLRNIKQLSSHYRDCIEQQVQSIINPVYQIIDNNDVKASVGDLKEKLRDYQKNAQIAHACINLDREFLNENHFYSPDIVDYRAIQCIEYYFKQKNNNTQSKCIDLSEFDEEYISNFEEKTKKGAL